MNFREVIKQTEKMLGAYRPHIEFPAEEFRRAAVLILLMDVQGEAHVLFTKRTETVEHHKGQISFPGGMQDPEDRTLEETALREAQEEVGVPPQAVRLIGRSDDFYTITNFLVSPFVGELTEPAEFVPNDGEVAQILIVPLSLFLTDDKFEIRQWEYQGESYDVYYYHFNGEVIWGATALMMNRFVDLVFGYNPAPNPILQDPRNLRYLIQNQKKGAKL
ncbi:MAG: hypothetical protein Kow0037_23210 [Calditrichia bacterium]